MPESVPQSVKAPGPGVARLMTCHPATIHAFVRSPPARRPGMPPRRARPALLASMREMLRRSVGRP